MARNRLIKKEFFRSAKIGALPFGCRLLFQALWIAADDTGYGLSDPRLLKGEVFPYDDITADTVQEWLNLLAGSKMISLYEVNSQKYFHVINFLEHQTINKPSGFRYPRPLPAAAALDGSGDPTAGVTEHSVSTTGVVRDDSSMKEKVKEKVKGRGKVENDKGGATPHFENPKMPDLRFDALRKIYLDGFERKSPNLKAPFEASDGKALQALLRRQPQATAEELTRWLKNAFASDDVPPLRHSFRLREFCTHAEKYAKGPLKRGGAKTRSAAADETQGSQLEGLTL
jgi:hypothetical protein